MKACTIIARNYLAHARVLADSFLEHNPDASFTVLVIDVPPTALSGARERFETLHPTEVGLDVREFHRMAMIYDVLELATAVKPWLLRYLIADGEEDVAYFDPDIQVFAPLDEISTLAREHNIVLTPHTVDAMPREGNELAENTILIAGMYNLGFLGLGPGDESMRFFEWWMERVARDCLVDPERGRFVDQRWVDFVPSLFDAHILRDQAYNVAWWNLAGRDVAWTGTGYEVNGRPLRFFHFSGYSADKPHLLSFHQGGDPPVLLSEQPDLARICGEYGERLLASGFRAASSQPYGLARLPSGIPIDKRMRRLYREALADYERGEEPEPPNPFDPTTSQRFVEWLLEPLDPVGGAKKISRYLDAVYAESGKLQLRFPNLRWKHADAYLEWVRTRGRHKKKIPLEFVPAPAAAETAQDLSIPGEPDDSKLQPGVNIAGYFRAELGVGEAARQLMAGIKRAQVPHTTLTYAATSSRQDHVFEADDAEEPLYDTNIICVNADQLLSFVHDVGPHFLFHRYSIGLWFWEIGHFPESLHEAFEAVNEVWVGSDFVAAAVGAATTKPVVTLPLGLELPKVEPMSRAELGLPDGFLFLFSFDFLSVFERKNPLGLIEAFKRAFEPDEGPTLVLKSINGDKRLASLEKLRLASDRSDILIIDEYLASAKKNSLMASCDAYVSLHRSEGFGLTMAEAMALGKPVIATRYSGNLMFMNEANSYLVPCRLSPIPSGCEPYPAGVEWAEPDIDAAAKLMRYVYEHQDEARKKGAQARTEMREHHGLDRTASFLANRLEEIRSAQTPPAVVSAGPDEALSEAARPLEQAADYLATGPRNPLSAPSRISIRAFARRLLFRLLRPYTVRHREFEESVVETLRELDVNIRHVQRELDVDLRHVQRELRAELRHMRREFRDEYDRLLERFDRADTESKATARSTNTLFEELLARVVKLDSDPSKRAGSPSDRRRRRAP